MTRRLTAVLAMTATGALALVGAQPATAAPAITAGHPTAVGASSHPAPPPGYHRALLAAAGRATVTPGRPVLSAAGVRPIGQGISTDLPSRLAVASDLVRVPYTVIVPTSEFQDPAVDIGLGTVVGRTAIIESETFVVGTPGQTTFRGIFTVPISAISALGGSVWAVGYGSATGGVAGHGAALPVTVKTNSLLGEAVTRRRSTVRVIGTAKVFTGAGAGYAARPGLRVGIDRYAGNGKYVRLAVVTTDRLGHLDVSIRVPWRVGIRLTDADTNTVFGAVTPLTAI